MAKSLLVYLHGFRSSPRSSKAVMTGEAIKSLSTRDNPYEWYCPQLLASPKLSMDMVVEYIDSASFDRLVVIGSSLGGFYATWIAVQRGWRAVLINPAVDPARDLSRYIGEQSNWHDPQERFFFAPEFVDELRALAVGPLAHAKSFMALIAKGDEVLDWREMTARYAGAQQTVLEGGDHALSDFDPHIPQVLAFLHLA